MLSVCQVNLKYLFKQNALVPVTEFDIWNIYIYVERRKYT